MANVSLSRSSRSVVRAARADKIREGRVLRWEEKSEGIACDEGIVCDERPEGEYGGGKSSSRASWLCLDMVDEPAELPRSTPKIETFKARNHMSDAESRPAKAFGSAS